MANVIPAQRRLPASNVLVIALPPVDLLVPAKQEEPLESVNSRHVGSPEPIGVKAEDGDRERDGHKQGAPDKRRNDCNRDKSRDGFQRPFKNRPFSARRYARGFERALDRERRGPGGWSRPGPAREPERAYRKKRGR